MQDSLVSLDIYTAAGGTCPVLVYVHGGAWRSGDKSHVGAKAEYFPRAGFVFVSANYRLVPEIRYPDNVRDIAQALAWVHDNIAKYGGDPNQIFVIGHSAGAHLAGLVATDERLLEGAGKSLSILKGAILLDSAAYDIPRVMQHAGSDRRTIYEFAFGTDPVVWQDASPLFHVAPGKNIPPFLLVHANRRPLKTAIVSKLSQALQEAGIRSDILEVPEKEHFALDRELGTSGDRVTKAVIDFITGA